MNVNTALYLKSSFVLSTVHLFCVCLCWGWGGWVGRGCLTLLSGFHEFHKVIIEIQIGKMETRNLHSRNWTQLIKNYLQRISFQILTLIFKSFAESFLFNLVTSYVFFSLCFVTWPACKFSKQIRKDGHSGNWIPRLIWCFTNRVLDQKSL